MFAEAFAMQGIARSLKENLDWRDGADVQKHLAYGPVVGRVVGEQGARIWRWIPRQLATPIREDVDASKECV